jgi:hypothetical protein
VYLARPCSFETKATVNAEAQRAEHSEKTKLKSNAAAKVKPKNAGGNNISLGKS